MLKSKLASSAKIIAVILLAFALISFSPRTNAQLRQVIIAPGFEFNVFADTSNVPDFAVSAFAGPTAMAFDSRGRLFVATLSGRILILLDNDDDGRLDQIKTYASGITQPLGARVSRRRRSVCHKQQVGRRGAHNETSRPQRRRYSGRDFNYR